ncbi:MAG: hypothetical protein NXI04_22725 [Planctomycetaceae bacterium]|nr:hypothetical protein [Planctomycetaceae bacterium]
MTESKKPDDNPWGCIIIAVLAIAAFFFVINLIAPYDPNADPYKYDPLADPDLYDDDPYLP